MGFKLPLSSCLMVDVGPRSELFHRKLVFERALSHVNWEINMEVNFHGLWQYVRKCGILPPRAWFGGIFY